jgi:hypothetical protein
MIELDENGEPLLVPIEEETPIQEVSGSAIEAVEKEAFQIESFENYISEVASVNGIVSQNPETFPELFSSGEAGDDVRSKEKIFSRIPNSIKLYTALLTTTLREKQEAYKKKKKSEK